MSTALIAACVLRLVFLQVTVAIPVLTHVPPAANTLLNSYLCHDGSSPYCLSPSALIALKSSDSNVCVCADGSIIRHDVGDEPEVQPDEPIFWWYFAAAAFLVVVGGMFAGLTIGIMSLDTTNLQILKSSGDPQEKKYAERIEPIRKHGHWVLSTLLLGNVVVNETLPILFDDIVGGGIGAIIISTALVVVFGEIIPNAICARHGLAVGAYFAPVVKVCMWIFCPIAYPIAKILDWLLGADEGTIYARAQLKTLVNLHEDTQQGDLNHDEVNIISAVLDLKDKTVAQIMTPLEDVFMADVSEVIDMNLIKQVVSRGHSRIPIYQNHRSNIVAILLVKRLIGYNVDKAKRIGDIPLTYLPIVDRQTNLFDMLNFFQEGRSHMAAVAGPISGPEGGQQTPQADDGKSDREIIGIITLEDVIEELIGEEIIDETDEYIDVHTKVPVRRTPLSRALSKLMITNVVRRGGQMKAGAIHSGGLDSPRPSSASRRPKSAVEPGHRLRKDGSKQEPGSSTAETADEQPDQTLTVNANTSSDSHHKFDIKPPDGYYDGRLQEAGWVMSPMDPDKPQSRIVLSRKGQSGRRNPTSGALSGEGSSENIPEAHDEKTPLLRQ